MIRDFFYGILKRRHFWRYATFGELGELYVSTMFRNLALSLIGIFVPVYMLRLGFSLTAIFMLFAFLFTSRAVCDVFAGYSVARIGPKHTILIAYGCQIATSLLFMTLPSQHWPLYLLGGLWGAANSFFFISYHTDFSKIKHARSGGRDIGWLNVMERMGNLVGPLVGGLVATVFGAQYTFLAAIGVMLAGLVPLFMSHEPTRTHQKLDFAGLPPALIARDIFAYSATCLENVICVNFWPLYLGLFVLTGEVYAVLGVLSSASMVMAMVAAYGIGRLIDRRQGRPLLRYGATINAGIYILRMFTTTVAGALGINLVNEVVTAAYRLPFYKGVYDAADHWPGHRIVYIVSLEGFADVIKAAFSWMLVMLSLTWGSRTMLAIAFAVAGVASLLIMTERFAALKTKNIL